jgi:DNA-binding protein H-NS
MTTYSELQAQIAELQKKADTVRNDEIAGAKAKIKEIMQTYGLTLQDLGADAKTKATKSREPVPAKYKDPVSGATWTGRGRAPLWLGGHDKNDFLIK